MRIRRAVRMSPSGRSTLVIDQGNSRLSVYSAQRHSLSPITCSVLGLSDPQADARECGRAYGTGFQGLLGPMRGFSKELAEVSPHES